MRLCALCGLPLPRPRVWERVLNDPAPIHDPRGPDAEVCWQRFCGRLGLDPETPPLPIVDQLRPPDWVFWIMLGLLLLPAFVLFFVLAVMAWRLVFG